MKDIKIAKNLYIPKENVLFYIAYDSNAVKKDVREKRKANQVYDYTNGKRILSVIYLKNGKMILVNTSLATLNQRMNQTDTEEDE